MGWGDEQRQPGTYLNNLALPLLPLLFDDGATSLNPALFEKFNSFNYWAVGVADSSRLPAWLPKKLMNFL